MLPDFPKAQKVIDDLFYRRIFAAIRESAPLVHRIVHRFQHEGKVSTLETDEGNVEEIDYKLHRVEISLHYQPERGCTLDDLLQKAEQMGREFGHKMESSIFQEIGAVADRTGNTVDLKGAPLDGNAFADLIEKVDTDFDENGTPSSMFVVSPEMLKEIQQHVSEWEKDPKLLVRLQEIRARKLEAFHAREANRRLVD